MSERIRRKTGPENQTSLEAALKRDSLALSQVGEPARTKVAKVARRIKATDLNGAEERVLRDALRYLLVNHGHLLVPARIRKEQDGGAPRWIITVHLRYPTGFEGEIGDLLYDGVEFTFLTPPDVRSQRAQRIAEDPEGIRQWNEFQASALSAGET